MTDVNPSFEKISQKLGTSFESSVSAVETELQVIEEKKNELQHRVESKTDIALRDQDYLLLEIKTLIQMTRSVLDRLDQDIKIGTEARKYEVFAALMNAVTGQLKELRELNKLIADIEVFKNPDAGKTQTQVKVEMTGRDMLDFLEEVRAAKAANEVDVTFDVDTVEPPSKGL